MKRSTERILTKPVGSMLHPTVLEELMVSSMRGEATDVSALAEETSKAVCGTVMQQSACGMDYVSNGEMSKLSFMEYPYARLTGFDGPMSTWILPDIADFPEAQDFWYMTSSPYVTLRQKSGPVVVRDQEAVYRDIAVVKEAFSSAQGEEAFVCAASPEAIANLGTNYYSSETTFLDDIVNAMQPGYRAIVDTGFILHVDLPDVLMMGSSFLHDRDQYRRAVQPRLDAIKHALTGLPSERVLLHAYWSNWPGPHHLDVPLDWILDLLLEMPAQGTPLKQRRRPISTNGTLLKTSLLL